MSDVQIKIPDSLQRKLESLNNPRRIMQPVYNQIGEMVEGDMREQPEKAQGAFTQLATAGQRRAYWAKVGSGEIQHGENGYIRSHKLRDGWKRKVTTRQDGGGRVEVFNAIWYANFVQGNDRQPFHAVTNWLTDGMEKEKRADDIETMILEAIRNA